MIDELDRIVTKAWSIYDNAALLSGRFLSIDLVPPQSPVWTPVNAKWQKSMRRRAENDPRASAVLEAVEAGKLGFEVSQQVRHQFTHRTRLQPITVENQSERTIEGRVILRSDVLAAVEKAVRSMGQELVDWGITRIQEPVSVPIHELGSDETYVHQMDRRADVDPAVFAPRVAAHAAWFANAVFEALSPTEDDRSEESSEHKRSRRDEVFSAEAAEHEIATSPLAGLATWVPPL
jgi:hypothetical protein